MTAIDGQSGFRSGNHDLDQWFRRHAWNNEVTGISRTYVLDGNLHGASTVAGFYCLSMSQIEAGRLSAPTGGPAYPWPMVLIGRLARHVDLRGTGTGERLLADAFERCLVAAEGIGCAGILIDAKAEANLTFYCGHGFHALAPNPDRPWPRTLFLPMATLRDSVALGSDAPADEEPG